MHKIKKYKDFEKTNESLGVVSIYSLFLLLYKIIQNIYIRYFYYENIGKKEEIELEKEIKNITGYDVKIYSCGISNKVEKGKVFALYTFKSNTNKIIFERGLRDVLTHRELISILLHECYHIKSKHSIKKSILSVFPYIPIAILNNLLLFMLIQIASEYILIPKLSKYQEIKSDNFAKKYGYKKI